MLDQPAGDGERLALARLAKIMEHHLQGEEALAGVFARRRVEADPVHQRVDRTAEHQRIGHPAQITTTTKGRRPTLAQR